MSFAAWAYILFTFSLVVVFAFIIVHYYNPRRKKEVEAPKHRMLDDGELIQTAKEDSMSEQEYPRESKNKVPKGVAAFFIASIIFVVVYVIRFTPAITGWSYYTGFEESMKEEQEEVSIDAAGELEKFRGNIAAIDEGKELFAASCVTCHKEDGTGGSIGSDLTGDLVFGDSPEELYESIAEGRGEGMPSFKKQLRSTKILKVIAFVETLRN